MVDFDRYLSELPPAEGWPPTEVPVRPEQNGWMVELRDGLEVLRTFFTGGHDAHLGAVAAHLRDLELTRSGYWRGAEGSFVHPGPVRPLPGDAMPQRLRVPEPQPLSTAPTSVTSTIVQAPSER